MAGRPKKMISRKQPGRRLPRLAWLLAAVLSGLIGSYLVFFSHADAPVQSAPSPPNHLGTFVTYQNYLYNISNLKTGGPATVYYTPVNADGSLAGWQATNSVPVISSSGLQDGYAYDGHLYVLDGAARAYDAPITANGSLGSWVTTASPPRQYMLKSKAAIYNSFMYLLGGITGTTNAANNGYDYYYGEVWYSSFMAGGGFGGWRQGPTPPLAESEAAAAIGGNYLYVLGGQGNVARNYGPTAAVYRAAIDPATGSLGGWQRASYDLPAKLTGGGAIVSGGYIYYAGGEAGGTVSNVMYRAAIGGNGDIGPWQQFGTLPRPATNVTLVINHGRLFSEGSLASQDYTPTLASAAIGSPSPLPVSGGAGGGSGSSGTGRGNGAGGGSGSSGSAAPAQQPNPTATSSPRGTETKQPDAAPNPFYDGKQYKPGSEQDIAVRTAAERRQTYGWRLAAGCLTAAGLTAVIIWRRRWNHEPSNRNRKKP